MALTEMVAAEIRATMGRHRVRQSELARRLGTNDTWLSVRLRGVQEIGLNDLERIATGLGVEVGDLLPRAIRVQTMGPNVGVAGRPRDNRPNGRPRRGFANPATRRPVPFEPDVSLLAA